MIGSAEVEEVTPEQLAAQAREKKEAEARDALKMMEASMQESLDVVRLDMQSEMGVFLLELCLAKGLRKTEAQLSTAVHVLRTADCHYPEDLRCAKIFSIIAGQDVTAGMESFLEEVLLAAKRPEPEAPAPPCAKLGDPLAYFGNAPTKKRKVHIDIAKQVELITLEGLKAQCWPRSQVVDHLASEVASLKDRGVLEPFVYVELMSWKPCWLMDGKDDPFEYEEQDDREKWLANRFWGQSVQPKSKRCSMHVWPVLFEQYQIGAAVCGQMPWCASTAHRMIVMQVAHTAPLKKRTPALAVIYDELCRKSWAERSVNGELGFKVAEAATVLDDTVLRQAENQFDCYTPARVPSKWEASESVKGGAMFGKGKGKGAKGAKGKARGDTVCYGCGQSGHKKDACPKAQGGVRKDGY